MISTDGVGVSILFIRDDFVGKRLPSDKKGISRELYIDELTDYSILQNKKIIGIDPGKTELSNYNRKTLQIDKFKTYINEKNRINHINYQGCNQLLFHLKST
jgi:hypothetical protein